MTLETREWREQPAQWLCPSCGKRKEDCEVPKGDGQTLRWLVEHHDHMRDFVKDYAKSKYGPRRVSPEAPKYKTEKLQFLDRVIRLAKRFDDIVICKDCNEVEGVIKQRIGADRYFTFHPWEIRRAYIPVAKQRHRFLEEHMPFYRRFYAEHEERLVTSRKRLLMQVVDAIESAHQFWGSSVEPTATFTDEELLVQYPTFDSGKRIADGLARGEPVLQGQPWIPEHDRRLRELASAGVAHDDIARELGRTTHAIRTRLESPARPPDA